MNQAEFNSWWAEFGAKFPAIGEWHSKLPNAKAVIDDWRTELTAVDLADAREVTARMVRREIDRVGPFPEDRQDTARLVAAAAKRISIERQREAARNRSWEQRLAEVKAEGDKPDEDGRRFACWECLDSGYVSVVDHREWNRRNIMREVKVLCRCGIGTQASEKKLSSGLRVKQSIRYDQALMFRWDGNETPQIREAFEEWYRYECQRAGRFDRVFDDYNSGAMP